jgi:outer membrane protein assembly factor BamA
VSTGTRSPFHRSQDLELEIGGESELTASGVTLRIDYDNTDWWNNPSEGSRTQFAVTRDWSGEEPGDTQWTQMEAQYTKYWSLGAGARAQARVIAFDAWISDVPSWDDFDIVDGEPLFRRPPVYMGSSLGGLFRQRGFASSRFSDRSAINYALEYRHTTERSLLARFRFLDRFGVDFTQLVGFVEMGRVAPEFDLGELHEDMKLTYGLGLRASAQSLVVRADLGFSDEGAQVQMFVGQPF